MENTSRKMVAFKRKRIKADDDDRSKLNRKTGSLLSKISKNCENVIE